MPRKPKIYEMADRSRDSQKWNAKVREIQHAPMSEHDSPAHYDLRVRDYITKSEWRFLIVYRHRWG